MLTLEYVLKIARLLDQTGEPRPGYLHDEQSNLEGYGISSEDLTDLSAADGDSSEEGDNGDDSISVSLDYEVDPKSGYLRIIQKESTDK